MAAPYTRTRLKGIVTLKVIKPELAGLADREAAVPTDADSYLLVGAATKITITETRENSQRYELTGDYKAFEPAETYPGKVSYEVSLDRADLYEANLLEAFGLDVGSNIVNQLKALTIFVEQPAPEDDNKNPLVIGGAALTPHTLIIPGCWLNGYSTEYNIDDADQKYVLSVTMIARTVISV